VYCNSQRRWQTANIVGSLAKRREDCSFALIFSSTVLHLPYLSLVSSRHRRGAFTRYKYPVSAFIAFAYKYSQTLFKKWPVPSHRKVRSLSVKFCSTSQLWQDATSGLSKINAQKKAVLYMMWAHQPVTGWWSSVGPGRTAKMTSSVKDVKN